MEWLFDGLGTTVITFILGLLIGGGSGYAMGINRVKIRQKQRSRDDSTQIQVGEIRKDD